MTKIKYKCDEKEKDKTYYVTIIVDEINSTMHKKCMEDIIENMCSDCKNQSNV